MLVVRKSKLSDIDQLLEISAQTGDGMTTMPNDRQSWLDKLERSVNDFSKQIDQPNGDVYFLVLEDTSKNTIAGCCAVYAGVGLKSPFYNYKLSTISKSSDKLDLTVHTKILSLVNDYAGCTELGSLFVLPEYRKNGIGKFLSRSRLMLIADFPERFDKQVFAELRGWLNEDNESPFWQHMTSKFFDITYQQADFMSEVDGSKFIGDLMPKYPIYLELLPKEAQDIVGKPNKDAIGAVKILEREGFQYTGYVDIFDAGPCLQSNARQINTVRDSQLYRVAKILDDQDKKISEQSLHIVSNADLQNYKIVCQTVKHVDENMIVVNQSTADSLNLSVGNTVRCIKL